MKIRMFYCPECGAEIERVLTDDEYVKIQVWPCRCGAKAIAGLGLPSARESTRVVDYEYEDDRPSQRRGVTGPLIKVK